MKKLLALVLVFIGGSMMLDCLIGIVLLFSTEVFSPAEWIFVFLNLVAMVIAGFFIFRKGLQRLSTLAKAKKVPQLTVQPPKMDTSAGLPCEEMIALAEEKCPGFGQKYRGIDETNWQDSGNDGCPTVEHANPPANIHTEIMKRGQAVYDGFSRRQGYTYCNRKFADASSTLPPAYILVENRFTTGHDDSAEFVELIDQDENIIVSWMFEGELTKWFEKPAFSADDCLVYYLRETLKLNVVQNSWYGAVGEL